MLFTIACHDKPGHLTLRNATRPAHLAYVARFAADLTIAGPLLDPEGEPCGSLFVMQCADHAAAEAFAAGDPYEAAGLFRFTAIFGFRIVVKDGGVV